MNIIKCHFLFAAESKTTENINENKEGRKIERNQRICPSSLLLVNLKHTEGKTATKMDKYFINMKYGEIKYKV